VPFDVKRSSTFRQVLKNGEGVTYASLVNLETQNYNGPTYHTTKTKEQLIKILCNKFNDLYRKVIEKDPRFTNVIF
jgi:hypothetical protein